MKNDTKSLVSQKTNNPSIFDATVLTTLATEINSDTLIKDLSKIFFRNMPKLLDEIEIAWKAGDNKSLKQSFHSLKGNAATLGMEELRTICAGLELTYRTSKNPSLSKESLDSLKTASHQAAHALKDFLETL